MTPIDIFQIVVLWLAMSTAAPYTGCETTGPQLTTATECWIVSPSGGEVWITPNGLRYGGGHGQIAAEGTPE